MQAFTPPRSIATLPGTVASASHTRTRAAIAESLKSQTGQLDQAARSLSVLIRQHCQSVPALG